MPLPLVEVLMFVHIAAGLLCLVVGPFVMLHRPKGGTVHKRAGRVFLRMVAVLAATAVVLLCVRWNPFFFALSVLSFYFAFSGWRVLAWRKTGRVALVDRFAALATVGTGAASVWLYHGGVFGRDAGIVLGTLGFAVVAALYDLWRMKRGHTSGLARFYLMEHLTKMSGAFLAIASAFSGTVLTFLPVAVAQTWPAVVGVPVLLFVANGYYRRLGRLPLPLPPSARRS